MDLQQDKTDFDSQDTVVLSVFTNSLDILKSEGKRFSIDTTNFPMAMDSGGTVGKKFGAWGHGMHTNNFGHGFVLIDKSGVVRWHVEEPSMYVEPKLIVDKLRQVNAS